MHTEITPSDRKLVATGLGVALFSSAVLVGLLSLAYGSPAFARGAWTSALLGSFAAAAWGASSSRPLESDEIPYVVGFGLLALAAAAVLLWPTTVLFSQWLAATPRSPFHPAIVAGFGLGVIWLLGSVLAFFRYVRAALRERHHRIGLLTVPVLGFALIYQAVYWLDILQYIYRTL
ncbi:hypothetical protein [Tahibacter amnicola]|uniref:Tripartite tricarboxylate transporter TctB family protein n=1 Tax=Tahibacter amnicola TaxID=2976241 RepID=A0ABY6BMW5_9GAMM|nr:hypothetical protein [Tahibacter amnicola]UXI69162.1 hypothetical protein N4264_05805 [Tahibacter amnicola]